jgi:hypothetical protein
MRRLEYQSRRVGVVERRTVASPPEVAETLRSAHLDASEEAESRRLTVFAPARTRDLWSPVRSGGGKLKA